MLYDVSVTRTSTASLTIRVEAVSREEAQEKAVQQAHDEDYTGCLIEYDFDADSAVEVADDNAPDRADETDAIADQAHDRYGIECLSVDDHEGDHGE